MRNLSKYAAFVFAGVLIVGVSGCGTGDTKPESIPGPPTPAPALPNNFEIVQKAFTWGKTFEVKAGGVTHARIVEKLFTWGRTFRYENNNGLLVASAHAKPFSWGVHIDVFDSSGALIGSIKEDLNRSIFSPYTIYHILDANGQEVALSKKYQLFSTDITLTNPRTGQQVANMHRNALNFLGDTWYVSVQNREGVDPRLLVVISAFKTAEDADRAADDD